LFAYYCIASLAQQQLNSAIKKKYYFSLFKYLHKLQFFFWMAAGTLSAAIPELRLWGFPLQSLPQNTSCWCLILI
jgi:hypothetical protein